MDRPGGRALLWVVWGAGWGGRPLGTWGAGALEEERPRSSPPEAAPGEPFPPWVGWWVGL